MFIVDKAYVKVAANHLHQENCTYNCAAILKITQDGQIWGAIIIDGGEPNIVSKKKDKFIDAQSCTLIKTQKELRNLSVSDWVLIDVVKPRVTVHEEPNFDWVFSHG